MNKKIVNLILNIVALILAVMCAVLYSLQGNYIIVAIWGTFSVLQSVALIIRIKKK